MNLSFPDTSLSSFQQRAAENAVIASFRSLTDDLVAPASKFFIYFKIHRCILHRCVV